MRDGAKKEGNVLGESVDARANVGGSPMSGIMDMISHWFSK